jgi:peptide/nickel transport system substrate-binding protein
VFDLRKASARLDVHAMRWWTVGFAALAGALLLLAFVPTAESRPSATDRALAGCDSGSPNDTLRVAVPTFGAETMDPSLESRSLTFSHLLQMWDTLIGIGPNNSLAPGLATKWTMARDGKSWTFQLRKGVKFSNGETFGADDVQFSLARHMHPAATASHTPQLRTAIWRIVVVNPSTVKIITHGVQAGLPYLLTPLNNAVVIYPKTYMTTQGGKDFAAQSRLLATRPVGSGTYRFVERVRGDCMLFQSVPNNRRGAPEFKFLQVLLVPNQATKVSMLLSGGVDLVALSPDDVSRVRNDSMRIVQVSRGNPLALLFAGTYRPATAGKPITDARVRHALSLAIDRRGILKALLNGQGVLPVTPFGTVPTTADIDVKHFAPWAKEMQTYDPAKARTLLRQAGYPNGFSGLKLFTHTQGGTFLPSMAQVIASQWKAIGVDVTLVPTTYTALRPHVLGADINDAYSAGAAWPLGSGAYFDATTAFSVDFKYEGGTFQLLKNPTIDSLAARIASERNAQKRKQLVSQAYDRANNSWVSVPLIDGNIIYAANPKRTGRWKRVFPGWGHLSLTYENIRKP